MSKRGNGEGSIYRRADGRWASSLSVEGPLGKRTRKTFYGKNRKEVSDRLRAALRQRDQGIPLPDDRQTFGSFIEQWLENSARRSLRPSTYENYSHLIRGHILPDLGHIPISKLSAQHVQEFLNIKLQEGLSTRTVRYLLTLIRRTLTLAMKWGVISRNVASLVEPPRLISREVRPMSQDEAATLFSSIQGDRLRNLYTITLALGLRRGEAIGLRWQDVDLEEGVIRITGALQRLSARGEKLRRVDVKSASSRRSLLLPKIALNALRSQRILQKEERMASDPLIWRDTGYVFTSGKGTPLDPRTVTRMFARACDRAGLPRFRFHDLRHSAATFLLSFGNDPKTVSDILGHSDVRVTLSTYTHVVERMRQRAASSMDAILSSPTGEDNSGEEGKSAG
jgi:integrase